MPLMFRMPGERPGDTVPPALETFPVIVPVPVNDPPLMLSLLGTLKLPPLSVVSPALCVYVPLKAIVPLEARTEPLLLKIIGGVMVDVPAPPDFVNVPVLRKFGVAPMPQTNPASLCTSNVPLLVMLAPSLMSKLAPVRVTVPLLMRAREVLSPLAVPVLIASPAPLTTVVVPVPLIVPADQVYGVAAGAVMETVPVPKMEPSLKVPEESGNGLVPL